MVLFIVVLIVLCVGLYVIDETYKTIKSILEGNPTPQQIINSIGVVAGIIVFYVYLF